MITKRAKTYSAKPSEIDPFWHVMDATGKPLGRLAVEVARILQGKHKPTYTAHVLTGDFVVVVNASHVGVTGRKRQQKTYYRHTGYPGGLRTTTLQKLLDTHPDRAIKHAVRGMLPKNILARRMLSRLKVYAGAEHPHEAQITGSLKRLAASRPSIKTEE